MCGPGARSHPFLGVAAQADSIDRTALRVVLHQASYWHASLSIDGVVAGWTTSRRLVSQSSRWLLYRQCAAATDHPLDEAMEWDDSDHLDPRGGGALHADILAVWERPQGQGCPGCHGLPKRARVQQSERPIDEPWPKMLNRKTLTAAEHVGPGEVLCRLTSDLPCASWLLPCPGWFPPPMRGPRSNVRWLTHCCTY